MTTIFKKNGNVVLVVRRKNGQAYDGIVPKFMQDVSVVAQILPPPPGKVRVSVSQPRSNGWTGI